LQEKPHLGQSHACYPAGGHLIAVLQSIVPEVDEEEEDRTVEALSATFPHPEESPKNLKRKASLVDLVLVSTHPSVTEGYHLDAPLVGGRIPDAAQG
jgi:hypothetical protein